MTTTGTTPVTTAVAIPPASGAAQATDYGFDAAGDQTTVTDEATASGTPQTWTSAYNLLGQVTSRQDPDTGLTSGMQYDFNGNLLQSTDSLGKTISAAYDALNRKTAEYDAATPAQAGGNELASWAYDNSNDAVPGMTDPAGQLTTSTSYAGRRQRLHPAGRRVHRPRRAHRRDRHHPARPRARSPGSYQFTHTYTAISGGPRTPTPTPRPGTLPAETVTHAYGYANGLNLPTGLAGHRRLHRATSPGTSVEPARHPGESATPPPAPTSPAPTTPTPAPLTDARLQNTAAGSPVLDDTSYTYDPAGNPASQTETRNGAHVRDPVLRLRHPGPPQAGMDRDRRLRRRPVGGLRRHRRRRDPGGRLLDELDLHPPRPAPDRDRPRPRAAPPAPPPPTPTTATAATSPTP